MPFPSGLYGIRQKYGSISIKASADEATGKTMLTLTKNNIGPGTAPVRVNANSRLVSAPPRRRSTISSGSNHNNMHEKLNQALFRLPGDARGSNESINGVVQLGAEPEELDAAELEESLNRRRLSNLKWQEITRNRILVPMTDVDKNPEVIHNEDASNSRRPSRSSTDQHRGSIRSNQSQILPAITATPDDALYPSTSEPVRKTSKFASIAKGLTAFSKKQPTLATPTSTEEHPPENGPDNNFLQKYGIQRDLPSNHTVKLNNSGFWKKNMWQYMKSGFVMDSSTDMYYYWIVIVSTAYLYNLLFVIFRCVFFIGDTISTLAVIVFVVVDVITDIIYVIDRYIRSRTGYLDQGMLVTDVTKILKLYRKSHFFYLDIISVLPLDYVLEYFLNTPKPIFRLTRLFKLDRMTLFISATETRGVYDTLYRRYVYSFYWSTLILTTIGEVPGPVQNIEFAFVTLDLMCGVLIFATIVGNVGSMIANISAARTEFQSRVDGIKQYMDLRKVSKVLENRVIKWFDYLWANKQSLADQQALKVLPDKLQAEIAMHVHFETLRKVRIFQDCEAGLLAELVLKLELQVFSPGDYVCRKGDIGREMYIVKRGKLEVVSDEGTTAFTSLGEGHVFGELSILNIAGNKQGNRRSANIRSVGYSDLFALSKDNLWEALREFPEAKKVLIQKGREILRKDNMLDEDAPHEHKTAEELALQLQNHMTQMQTRLARVIAEQTNQTSKLMERVIWLEKRLSRYENINVSVSKDAEGRISFYETSYEHEGAAVDDDAQKDADDIDDDEEVDDEEDGDDTD
uniref:Cyclic nucleotide-binding domain-containing protein n=2 Tax=Panagrellus redivivus TaxID=6233 RepID=A0A7E4WC21_PANRE